MNILFLSKYYPGDLSSKCSAISKIGLNWAAHNLCTAMLHGFRENNATVFTLNTTPMGSFPAFSKTPCVPGYREKDIISPAYCNIAYLKRIDTRRRVLRSTLEWCRNTEGEKIILFYNFYDIDIIPRLKREFPDIKAVSLVTDLPEYTSPRKSILTTINEIISPPSRIKRSERLAGLDGFILLASAMTERLAIDNRPWTLIEGIYNDEATLEKVEKDSHKVIMYTGNLGERYGIRTLLDAFALIKSPDYRLWIRGDGDLEQLVRQRAEADNRIVIMGNKTRKELLTLLQQATLLVNPVLASQKFTKYFFPSKTLEFMASGTPTLMSKLDCMPAEYAPYLYYFKGESCEQIADQIMGICNQPKEVLNDFGNRASQFILTNKSPKPQMAKALKFFHDLQRA